MAVHRHVHSLVPLAPEHVARWLQLWRDGLDACFSGPVAEVADPHARRMTSLFLRDLTRNEPARSLPLLSNGAAR